MLLRKISQKAREIWWEQPISRSGVCEGGSSQYDTVPQTVAAGGSESIGKRDMQVKRVAACGMWGLRQGLHAEPRQYAASGAARATR